MTTSEHHFQMDKKITWGLILAFIVQTVVVVSTVTSKYSDMDHRLQALEKFANANSNHEPRIVVLEQVIVNIKEVIERSEVHLNRIEEKLDSIRYQPPQPSQLRRSQP